MSQNGNGIVHMIHMIHMLHIIPRNRSPPPPHTPHLRYNLPIVPRQRYDGVPIAFFQFPICCHRPISSRQLASQLGLILCPPPDGGTASPPTSPLPGSVQLHIGRASLPARQPAEEDLPGMVSQPPGTKPQGLSQGPSPRDHLPGTSQG